MNSLKKLSTLIVCALPLVVNSPQKYTFRSAELIDITTESQIVYDELSHTFLSKEGGVDENIFNLYFCSQVAPSLEYFDDADSYERKRYFFPKDSIPENLDRETVYQNMKRSFNVILSLESRDFDEIDEEKEYLKMVMNELDSIKNDSQLLYPEKLRKSYTLITENIVVKQIPDSVDNGRKNVPIELSISGFGGVCRDAVTTVYPLLTYYGYDVSYVLGYVEGETKVDGVIEKVPRGHIWLEACIEKDTFHLDSHWYGKNFIPLEKRLHLDVEKFDEKFVTRKYNK